MTDEINDYEDALRSLNDDAQKLTAENDQVSFRCDDLKTEFKACSKTCQDEVRIN